MRFRIFVGYIHTFVTMRLLKISFVTITDGIHVLMSGDGVIANADVA